ncbi:FKBP-type peptidyl-prolyl cis-trans isomerase [Entomospira culicis]|uniref:Peptidyl-prolyl cis-trans isomerase n=1 Tax=Entomospira culicis TaxID=2719989 RepID=A0A968KWC2_9SPIO|nr:peptidylprolyl isomerase [Entomospira culicis]NIZ18822.1 peptidylprolyl isomerase [Entomospira culicis]NIZ69037.1 peptidylprolyl isomerase [Entomospira culicis]WDI37625.1 peptidylprolyl isomerase [Entomospira culicis]WDI39253.1 peptidylprolyl isomerase [Entomospira culicis]
MKISHNSAVIFNYSIKDEHGTLLESNANEHVGYIHGSGTTLPGFEAALDQKEAGYTTTIVLSPEEAFGHHDESLIIQVPIDDFHGQDLSLNMEFVMDEGEADEAGTIVWRISELGDETVTLDGNHPYAGKTLTFDIEVKEVRTATDEELEHGHLHFEGDEHHHHDN